MTSSSDANSMDLKSRFYRVYQTLPINVRREVVLVVNNEPLSWQVAELEIDNNTALADSILNKLDALEII